MNYSTLLTQLDFARRLTKMLNRISRTSFDRFLPLAVGIVGIGTSLGLGSMSTLRGFQFISVVTFPLIGAISYWFTFGTMRLWIRYLGFTAIFFTLPQIVTILDRQESSLYMYSAFSVMLMLLNQLLRIGGLQIQKVYNYRKKEDSQSITAAAADNQFTLRDLMQLTFFIAVTFALFGLWHRNWTIDWLMVSRFVTGERQIIAFYILNIISILTALPQRRIIAWLVLDTIVVFCTLWFLTFEQKSIAARHINFILNLNLVWLTTYSIPRVFGYRWTWQLPWKRRSREAMKIDSPQIAEPPIVVRQNPPPALPKSDEQP